MGKAKIMLFRLVKKLRSRKNSQDSLNPGGMDVSSLSRSPLAIQIQDCEDLQRVFDKFDANGDGKISIEELQSMIKSLGSEGSDEEVVKMMKAADLDGDGYINLEEFISINTSETDSSKCVEDLKNAFTIFDKDNNGLITAEELCLVFHGLGERKSLGECQKMIKGIDQNGDGAVNFEEFMQMMTRLRT